MAGISLKVKTKVIAMLYLKHYNLHHINNSYRMAHNIHPYFLSLYSIMDRKRQIGSKNAAVVIFVINDKNKRIENYGITFIWLICLSS